MSCGIRSQALGWRPPATSTETSKERARQRLRAQMALPPRQVPLPLRAPLPQCSAEPPAHTDLPALAPSLHLRKVLERQQPSISPSLAARPSSRPVTSVLARPQYGARGIIPDQGLNPRPLPLRAASQPLDLQGSPGLSHSGHEPLGQESSIPSTRVSCFILRFSASLSLSSSWCPVLVGLRWSESSLFPHGRLGQDSGRVHKTPLPWNSHGHPHDEGQLSKGPPTAVGPPGLEYFGPVIIGRVSSTQAGQHRGSPSVFRMI